jgi:predicted nuclease of predicted toxin-antitoxin system
MIFWLDAQLSPALATWISATFGIATQPVRDLGLREAKDVEIFQAARSANAVVITKDADFVELVERLGPPPQVLWITCGNTTNARLKQILSQCLPSAIPLLETGEPLIEIADSP